MANPGTPLAFSDENKRNLEGSLKELVSGLEAQRQVYQKRVDVWWDWYEAKPEFSVRNDPWPNASNVVVPLIRTHADALHANYINTIFSGKGLWIASSGNEDFKERYLPHIPDYWNLAAAGNEFDTIGPLMDAVGEMCPIGQSVLGLRFERRERFVFLPGHNGRPRAQQVTLSRGPIIEHLHADQCMWQEGRTIQESEFFIKQSLLTWGDIARQVQTGGWDPVAAEVVHGAPARDVNDRIKSTLDREGISVEGPDAYQLYDIRECWLDWPLLRGLGVQRPNEWDSKTPSIPIVVTFNPDSGRILRVIAHPYSVPGWPFYEIYFRKRPGRGSSTGLSRMLEHLQRAVTTMVNQSIDSVTLANAIHSKTTDPKLKNLKLNMNQPIYLQDMSDFETLNMPKQVIPDIALINLLWGMGERLTGVGDPMLGKETRMGGHPSPATSTLALMQQANKLFAMGLKQLRTQVSRLGEDSLAIKQQFFKEVDAEAIQSMIGQRDAAPVIEYMMSGPHPYGNMTFDLHTLSETHNPQVELQRAIMVDQVVANFYSRAIQLVNILMQSQGNPMIQGVVDVALRGLSKTISGVLESAEVDDIEDFLLQTRESGYAPEQVEQLGGELSERVRGTIQQGTVVPAGEVAVGSALSRAAAPGSTFGA
jgi:hypothetical protein